MSVVEHIFIKDNNKLNLVQYHPNPIRHEEITIAISAIIEEVVEIEIDKVFLVRVATVLDIYLSIKGRCTAFEPGLKAKRKALGTVLINITLRTNNIFASFIAIHLTSALKRVEFTFANPTPLAVLSYKR